MRLVAGLALGIIAAGSTFAQDVISARSGVVHYVEGRTFLNDKLVELKFGQLPPIKENQLFRTDEGRAEILLTPGSFLRMQENSIIRMVSTNLSDTRIELLSGSAMVECDDVPKDNSIMLLYKSNTMLMTKHGLYKIAATPGSFQVFDGEAIVKGDSSQLTLKTGKETALDGVLMAQSFDKKADEDDLYRWSSRRSAMLAKASVSSAMGLRNGYTSSNSNNGYSNNGCYSGYGSSGMGFGWQWNPMFGMCTFVPMRGIAYSPFGYGFYSPNSAYSYFYSPTYYNSGGGGGSAASSGFTPYSNSQLGYAASEGRMSSGGSSAGFSGGSAAASSGGGAAAAAGGSSRGGGGASSGGGGGASRGR